MKTKTMLFLSMVLVLGLSPLFAASPNGAFAFNVSGTLGPNENGGPDCLSADGQTFTGTVTFSTTAKPTATTATTATYRLAPGKITFQVGTDPSFTNTAAWKATFNTKLQALTLKGAGPDGSSITAYLRSPAGTYTAAVLKHPQPLATSPVNNATPSYVTYSAAALGCPATKLGYTGSYSN